MQRRIADAKLENVKKLEMKRRKRHEEIFYGSTKGYGKHCKNKM